MSSASFPPPALAQIAQEVASLLKSRKETLSVAETAAGGLVSAAILATPGASQVFRGGLTLYTLESRIAFAGWTQDDVKKYGGPTPESGTAGPTASGKTQNRQPGYVALAVSGGPKGTVSKDLNTDCGNDRTKNMVAFAVEALKLVKEVISGDEAKI
ncbi:CinA-like protein [Cyphellophora attinorum]|uniref:CinA-like protein n=1 Tax=Cyphellophora attinorum TaxID=1664694 RepID=A0A0N1H7R1_9EURO|nr:CinA-like protein [Phialophora attinorum]KPI37704.1 CinA-like protein [Phialophora attinorum]